MSAVFATNLSNISSGKPSIWFWVLFFLSVRLLRLNGYFCIVTSYTVKNSFIIRVSVITWQLSFTFILIFNAYSSSSNKGIYSESNNQLKYLVFNINGILFWCFWFCQLQQYSPGPKRVDTMTINNYFLDPKKQSVDYSYWSNLLSKQHISKHSLEWNFKPL